MRILSNICAILLITLALPSPAPNADEASSSAGVDRAQTHQLESLMGREVRTRSQGQSGRIIDLLTDSDGKLQAAVVEIGGFLGIGTRKIAIDWRAFRFNTQDQKSFVMIEGDHEQLRQAPEYTASEPVAIVPTLRDD